MLAVVETLQPSHYYEECLLLFMIHAKRQYFRIRLTKATPEVYMLRYSNATFVTTILDNINRNTTVFHSFVRLICLLHVY